MALKEWHKLPVTVRRSRKNLYEYLVSELQPEPETRDLSITVNDGTDPVNGVAVAIGEITGSTGAQGGCTLSGVPDGEHTITATKEGFESYSDTITVSSESTSFTISLTAQTEQEGEPQE